MRNVRYQKVIVPTPLGPYPMYTGCCWNGTYPVSITLPVTYGLSVAVRRVRVQQRLGPFCLPSVITQQFLNRFFDPARLGSKDLPRRRLQH
jgi:hypothetical protein